jgi:DnaJ like chaperone protein
MGLGKWIVGGLGWAMFGPIGGLLGYFFTSSFEKFAEAAAAYQESQYRNQGERNSFLISLLVLSSVIIKADGKTTSTEMARLREFFARNFGPQAAMEAEKIVNELLQKDFNLHEVCDQISSNMNYAQKMQLFHYLVSLGASDGLVQKEVDVLETIAEYIGLTTGDRDSIMAQFKPDNDKNYKILEISPDATNDEVKKAYRRMAVKYHPDKVATLGEDIQKSAEEKFKAVSQAYDAICKERGI